MPISTLLYNDVGSKKSRFASRNEIHASESIKFM
jgi:hypothetical protein